MISLVRFTHRLCIAIWLVDWFLLSCNCFPSDIEYLNLSNFQHKVKADWSSELCIFLFYLALILDRSILVWMGGILTHDLET